MKKAIVFLSLVVFAISSQSQGLTTDSSHSLSKQDYLVKSKHQKTAGFVMLGGGLLLGGIGTSMAVSEAKKGATDIFNMFFHPDNSIPGFNEKRMNAGLTMMFIGGLADLGSIPLFVSAGHNKKKAAEMSFSPQMVPGLNGQLASGHLIPSLSVKLHL